MQADGGVHAGHRVGHTGTVDAVVMVPVKRVGFFAMGVSAMKTNDIAVQHNVQTGSEQTHSGCTQHHVHLRRTFRRDRGVSRHPSLLTFGRRLAKRSWTSPFPPLDATEALQLKIHRELFDMFTTEEVYLARLNELNTQLEVEAFLL